MTFSNEQLDISHLPQVSDLIFEKLQRSYLSVMLLRFAFFSAAFLISLVVLYIFQPFDDVPSMAYLIFLGVGVLYTIWRYIVIIKGFDNKAFALRDKDIVYKTGWLWKAMTTTPFNRVQHISIEQGPIERNWNLARLKLFTAGGNTSDLSIPGLDYNKAEELKEYISRKTRLSEQEEE
ncbi:PH domain-containing protein [Saprospiraceae bacterium]|nr:PH domain-containing protein [Saprospiraceae bacterium]